MNEVYKLFEENKIYPHVINLLIIESNKWIRLVSNQIKQNVEYFRIQSEVIIKIMIINY